VDVSKDIIQERYVEKYLEDEEGSKTISLSPVR
jgi:hypothetical protein